VIAGAYGVDLEDAFARTMTTLTDQLDVVEGTELPD
jgi:hypothetical protein